jgi:hypothetical protein
VTYWIGKLLDVLAASAIDESRIAHIEWGLAPLLRSERSPKVISRELARNPALFADMLSLIFRDETEEKKEVTEEERRRATAAFHVLDNWHTLPGVAPDGSIDADALREWVHGALQETAQRNRPTMGAQFIGHVLTHCPNGADGVWPHEAVRNIIETAENEQIEKGFYVEHRNSRGVVTKSLKEGGAQERSLADRYAEWSMQLRDRWPRTAKILKGLAENYRHEASHEDDETDLREDGMW